MQTKHVSWSTSELRVRLVHLNQFKPPPPPPPHSKIFYWPFPGGASFVDHLCCFCLVLLCFHARLFVDALWSPAGKRLTSWLSFVMSKCDVVTFSLVSWVRCGAWLYRFLIFALFLALLLVVNCVLLNNLCVDANCSHQGDISQDAY